jgi:DNA-binding transcriptional ArsR family regulator
MLQDLFRSGEFVRVVDFLLDEPDREFNKSEIAEGAGVSRPTLYKLWDRVLALGLVCATRRQAGVEFYRLDAGSPLVKSLLRFDSELAKRMAEAGISTPEPNQRTETTRAPGRLPKIRGAGLGNRGLPSRSG